MHSFIASAARLDKLYKTSTKKLSWTTVKLGRFETDNLLQ